MGKGSTRFVSEPIGVRTGRQRQTFSARELEQDMAIFQETGVHPEIEKATRENEASPPIQPLPPTNQNRPFIFLELTINKTVAGKLTVELFDEHNPFGVGMVLNRCRPGSRDSLMKTTVHKLLTDFAFCFGKTRASYQLTPHPHLHHTDHGTLSCSLDGSEIAITLQPNSTGLDSSHQVVGRVHQGLEVLDKINQVLSGPLDIPMEEIVVSGCGLTDHRGVEQGESSGRGGQELEITSKELEEGAKDTQSRLQLALEEGLTRVEEKKTKKRKRKLKINYSTPSSSDSESL